MREPVIDFAGSEAVSGLATPVRVVLVDQDPILRSGLQMALASEPDIEIAGVCDRMDQAIGIAAGREAVVIVSESQVGDQAVAQLAEKLKAASASARIVVLARVLDEQQVRAAMGAGARAYLSKEDGYAQLVTALRAVARGRRFLSDSVEGQVLEGYARRVAARHEAGSALITPREREVLVLIGQGRTNKHIAKELSLSFKTVEKHRSNLMRKLGLHNTAAVTVYAMRQGLVNR